LIVEGQEPFGACFSHEELATLKGVIVWVIILLSIETSFDKRSDKQ
jgi:hypothetical protein